LENFTEIDMMIIEFPDEIKPLYNLSACNITNLTLIMLIPTNEI